MTADPRPIRAVAFPVDPAVAVAAGTVDCSGPGLWAHLGGQPEYLTLPGDAVLCFRSDGKTAHGVPRNPRATRFADGIFPGFARADMIMGPVLMFGFDETGLPADVPAELEQDATRPGL